MNKTLILNELINHFSNGSKSNFAKKIEVSPQMITNWLNRNTFDLERVYTKCENVNPNWLLTGKGSMLKEGIINTGDNNTNIQGNKNQVSHTTNTELLEIIRKKDEQIDSLLEIIKNK